MIKMGTKKRSKHQQSYQSATLPSTSRGLGESLERRRDTLEWVEIVEPRSGEHMYANLTTGECAWEPPPGVPVKPTDERQWWELFDPNTGRFYYYNAASASTVWHRPTGADIIPLAKLQASTYGSYDVPRSPSSSSTTSAHPPHSPLADPRTSALRTHSTASSHTQTSPSASPKAQKKHHHHHHHRQASASRAEEVVNRRDRNALQEAIDRQIAEAAAKTQLKGNKSPDEVALKLKTDEITAEVERFFAANQERGTGAVEKFPIPVGAESGPQPRWRREGKVEGAFARAFADASAQPPPLPPHGGRGGGQQSPILALRKAVSNASSSSSSAFSGSSTLGNRRTEKPSSVRRQSPELAKIVKTSKVDMEESIHSQVQEMTAESESSGSRDSTPNPTRRPLFNHETPTKSLTTSTVGPLPLSPLANRQKKYAAPPTVKEAQITAIAGSPKLWASKAAKAETESPVWTARSELAMVKSLDSGIRSGDSNGGDRTEENRATEEKTSPLGSGNIAGGPTSSEGEASPRPLSSASPKPKPRLSIRQNQSQLQQPVSTFAPREERKEQVSLAQPYQQLAPLLAYSQQHHQLILAGTDLLNSSADSRHQESEEEEELLDEDDVFADDEDFGSQPSQTSSREDLRRTEGRGSGRRRVGSSPPANSPQAHYHPRPLPPQAPSLTPEQLFLATDPLNGNFLPPTAAKSRSGEGYQRNSVDKPFMAYPGDITPPSHRPQSMLVGAPQQHQLPPNTATLSRPPKRTPPDGNSVAVSRSASSLTKAQTFSSAPQESMDGATDGGTLAINCHKKGLFGKRQSLQSMMTWSRDTLKKPLIMTSAKEVKKEACGVFKRIQGYMGDRKVKAGVSTDQLALDVVFKGWQHPPLRDEIFVQLVKQTTDNPKTESLRRGWELLAICLSIFAPSESLLGFLEAHVARNADPVLDPPEVPVSHYASHCAKKLERAVQELQQPNGTGGGSKRGLRKPTLEAVEEARIQIFHPSMFGNTLDEVMANQRDKFPLRQLPWIQTTLSEMVLQLNGAQTEGIFRVPGDADEVNALKVRMDRWLVPQVPDPHVPASLLKLWYRELAQPLIPPNLYDDCLLAAENPDGACAIVERLPRINRLVLAYLIRFLQVFARVENAKATKMDASNLAMVMAPNILRCTSEDPRIIFENTRKEMAFLRTLMGAYDTAFMEGLL